MSNVRTPSCRQIRRERVSPGPRATSGQAFVRRERTIGLPDSFHNQESELERGMLEDWRFNARYGAGRVRSRGQVPQKYGPWMLG